MMRVNNYSAYMKNKFSKRYVIKNSNDEYLGVRGGICRMENLFIGAFKNAVILRDYDLAEFYKNVMNSRGNNFRLVEFEGRV